METRIVKLSELVSSAFNPRVELTAKDAEWKALDASIAENGLVLPLIVNVRDNSVISGHQRLNVLLAAGEVETRAVVVDMGETQAKALCIALNKLDGTWDYGQLSDILQELVDESEDLLSTGFTGKDIAELLGEINNELDDEQEETTGEDCNCNSVRCVVGEYTFWLNVEEFDSLVADIHETVGFTVPKICKELERRLFG